jgi:transcriptional regulator with XRE-family HTH domain
MIVGDRCDIFVFIGRHVAILIIRVIVIAVCEVLKTVKIAVVLLISVITMTDVATRLLEVHKQKGLSQQQVAEIAGVHFTNVGKYEKAEAVLSADVFNRISKTLEVSSDFLLNGTIQDKAKNNIKDNELLFFFKKIEKISDDKKYLVNEFLDTFILKANLQQQLS